MHQLRQQDLPEAPFPGGKSQAFRVYFAPEIHERVARHGQENKEVEICGVLVGKWARDADGPYVLISESIQGEAATNKFAEVTFIHETWAKINHEMDTRLEGLAIVGWYHSHPDFGVFLSDCDRFIQEHFFSGPGQVAYVVDPVRKTEGVFAWRDGKPTLCPFYWVGDRVQVATAAGEEPAPASPGTNAGPAPAAPATGQPAARPEVPRWPGLLMQAFLLVCVFLLGFLLSGRLNDLERFRIEQATRAWSLVYLGLRPGLQEDVARLNKDLSTVKKNSQELAKAHLQLAQGSEETRDQWQATFAALDDSLHRLRGIQAEYCLTPSETRLILQLFGGRAAPPEERAPAGKKDEQPRDDKAKPAEKKPEEKKQ